jgi:hypothetical protein
MIPVVMLKACNIPQLGFENILRIPTWILVQLIFDSLVYSQADARAYAETPATKSKYFYYWLRRYKNLLHEKSPYPTDRRFVPGILRNQYSKLLFDCFTFAVGLFLYRSSRFPCGFSLGHFLLYSPFRLLYHFVIEFVFFIWKQILRIYSFITSPDKTS